jgi:hypothetical protein
VRAAFLGNKAAATTAKVRFCGAAPVFTWLLPEKRQMQVFIKNWQSSGYRNRWRFLHVLFIKFALFNFLFVKIKKGVGRKKTHYYKIQSTCCLVS